MVPRAAVAASAGLTANRSTTWRCCAPGGKAGGGGGAPGAAAAVGSPGIRPMYLAHSQHVWSLKDEMKNSLHEIRTVSCCILG